MDAEWCNAMDCSWIWAKHRVTSQQRSSCLYIGIRLLAKINKIAQYVKFTYEAIWTSVSQPRVPWICVINKLISSCVVRISRWWIKSINMTNSLGKSIVGSAKEWYALLVIYPYRSWMKQIINDSILARTSPGSRVHGTHCGSQDECQ